MGKFEGVDQIICFAYVKPIMRITVMALLLWIPVFGEGLEDKVPARRDKGYFIGERVDSLKGQKELYTSLDRILWRSMQKELGNHSFPSTENDENLSLFSLGLNFGCGVAMNRAWLGGAEYDPAAIFFFFPFKGAIIEARKDIILKFGIASELGFLCGSRNDIHSHIIGGPQGFYRDTKVLFATNLFPLTFAVYYRLPIRKTNIYFGIYGIGFYLSRGIEYNKVLDENLNETGEIFTVRNWGRGICWQQDIGFEAPISEKLTFSVSIIARNGDIKEFKNDAPTEYKWNPADMKLNGLYFNAGFYYHFNQ